MDCHLIDPLSDIVITTSIVSLNGTIYKQNTVSKEWEEHYGQIIRCNSFQELINEMKQKISNTFILNNILSNNKFIVINYNILNKFHKNMVRYGGNCPSDGCNKLVPVKKVIMYYGNPIGVFEYHSLCFNCHNMNRY
jgi:hypothetical protein